MPIVSPNPIAITTAIFGDINSRYRISLLLFHSFPLPSRSHTESQLKMSHSQRQELAQQRREDKRRADKEKIMNEEDPEKQRRWEEAQYKKDMKKKQPRVKQMKMKAM